MSTTLEKPTPVREAPPGSRRPTLAGTRRRLMNAGLVLAVMPAILVLWQIAYSAEMVSRLVLPAPADVFTSLRLGLTGGTWWEHIWTTVAECALGFTIGVLGALALGSVLAFFEGLRRAIFPYVLAAQTFPKIAIAPLLVAWLGYGMIGKVVIGAMLAFFPVFVSTVAGLREVGQDEVNLLKSMQARRLQEFWYLRLPHALSYIFPALSVAAVHSLLGVIVGEFVGATKGLGFLIQQYSFVGDTAGVYAVLAVLALIGLGLYGLLVLLEKKTRFRTN